MDIGRKSSIFFLLAVQILMILSVGCAGGDEFLNTQIVEENTQGDASVVRSAPILQVSGWEPAQPLPAPIDMQGSESSSFITLDGQELYFFYTPDISLPEVKMALDGISGTYHAVLTDSGWSEPERLDIFSEYSLEGCIYADAETLWFCSTLGGDPYEISLYSARRENGAWVDARIADEQLNDVFQVGNLHFTSDKQRLFFASAISGGEGLLDIWQAEWDGKVWGNLQNLGKPINSPQIENFPFLSADGLELWFTAPSKLGHDGMAIFRSKKQAQGWGEPQEIISHNVNEVSMDERGNLYFTHYFMDESNGIVDAKIYVAVKRDIGVTQ